MTCAACGLLRDPDDLIAFWPVGYPGRVRFVCRPTRPSPVAQESCFRAVVESRRVHEIGQAIDPSKPARLLGFDHPHVQGFVVVQP